MSILDGTDVLQTDQLTHSLLQGLLAWCSTCHCSYPFSRYCAATFLFQFPKWTVLMDWVAKFRFGFTRVPSIHSAGSQVYELRTDLFNCLLFIQYVSGSHRPECVETRSVENSLLTFVSRQRNGHPHPSITWVCVFLIDNKAFRVAAVRPCLFRLQGTTGFLNQLLTFVTIIMEMLVS